jgi:NADH:ubiquinone oxidoreductase subunit 6 (subunit J)
MSLCFSTRAVVTAPLRTGEHFFMLLPTIILGLGVAMMLFPNPIHNLLCLIAIFGGTVVLYLHAGAEFLGFTFLIVFVGAVAILFLFVIMLLNIRSLASIDHTMNRKGRLACVAFPVILVLVYSFDCLRSAVVRSYTVESSALLLATTPGSTVEELYSFINHRFHDILIFAELLYTQY